LESFFGVTTFFFASIFLPISLSEDVELVPSSTGALPLFLALSSTEPLPYLSCPAIVSFAIP